MNEQQENKQEKYQVKVIANYKIAKFLLKQGFRIENFKKHRDYYSDLICKHCGQELHYKNDEKCVFAFIIENGFLEALDFAIKNYDDIGWNNEEIDS